MTKKFSALVAKMSPESRARSDALYRQLRAEMPCKSCGGRSISPSNRSRRRSASTRSPSQDGRPDRYVREHLAPLRRAMGGELRIVARFPEATSKSASSSGNRNRNRNQPNRRRRGAAASCRNAWKRAIPPCWNPSNKRRFSCASSMWKGPMTDGETLDEALFNASEACRGFWGGCWTKTNRSPDPSPPVTAGFSIARTPGPEQPC